MNEDTTQKLSHKAKGNSFEELVLASLEEIKDRLQDLEERAQKLETKAYDTKPMWKNALKEIAETRIEMREGFAAARQERREGLDEVRGEMREGFAKVAAEMRLMERKVDILNKNVLGIQARVEEMEDRLPQLELAP